jgi:hypothetical protein
MPLYSVLKRLNCLRLLWYAEKLASICMASKAGQSTGQLLYEESKAFLYGESAKKY